MCRGDGRSCLPARAAAAFRDAATLSRRIQEITGKIRGSVPVNLIGFAGDSRVVSLDSPLVEMPAEATNFSPPKADAIVLFSDGQFDLSQLRGRRCRRHMLWLIRGWNTISDARVDHLQTDGQRLSATMINSGRRRASRHFAGSPGRRRRRSQTVRSFSPPAAGWNHQRGGGN